jgi:hypothetical protein
MIVDDLDLVRFLIGPPETDAPLIVDPNAHLPGASAPQHFEPVSGRVAQVLDRTRGIQLAKFPQCTVLDVAWKLAASVALPDPFRLLALEIAVHSRASTLI